MLDIVERTQNEQIEGVIISCDFQKAFDRINHKSLLEAMKMFNFSVILQNWTEIIYTDFEVRVQNNGYFSNKIEVKQGLHQGGPCSSLYFLVIAEILANLLRQDSKIRGIPIDDIFNLLNQFADNLDVFSEASEDSI